MFSGRPVAVKQFGKAAVSSPGAREAYLSEVEIMRKLQHRNIVTFVAATDYCTDPLPCIVMELLPFSLADVIANSQQHPQLGLHKESIARHLAEVVHHLRSACRPLVLHGDIKPANILLDEHYFPKLTDFGTARMKVNTLEAGRATVNGLRGTHGYIVCPL